MREQNLTASSYLKRLSEIALQTQVHERTSEGMIRLSLDGGAQKAIDLILEAKSGSAKVMIVGNGGSAAIASHIQNDLCDSGGVKAIVFNEAPFLTAISNDDGYENFFETAAGLWAQERDILLAISSSGRSKSILRAVNVCLPKGVRIITLSGFDDRNPLRRLGHLNFYVASGEYGMVESAHALLGHFMTDGVMNARAVEVR